MTTAMEQVVTQLHQELLTIGAQIASRIQMSEAARAIDNRATAQVRKDTPSFIDVNGLGRPKEFSGKEKDFQQWAKKTEAFFAGVIKESEVMLEWAAEQTTEIATDLINCEFLPRSAEPGVCAAADAHNACGSHESRGERHCCQLAEELTRGVATTAETI